MSDARRWQDAAAGDRAALDALARDALRAGDVAALAELEALAWLGADDDRRALIPAGWLAIRPDDVVLDLEPHATLQPVFVQLRHQGADVWGLWDPLTSTWHGHLDRDAVSAVAVGASRLAMATPYGLVVQRTDGPPRELERDRFQPLHLGHGRPLLAVRGDTFAWVADGAVHVWMYGDDRGPVRWSVDTDGLALTEVVEPEDAHFGPLGDGWLLGGPTASRFVSHDGEVSTAGRVLAASGRVAMLATGDATPTLWWPERNIHRPWHDATRAPTTDAGRRPRPDARTLPAFEPGDVLGLSPRGGLMLLRHADGAAWTTIETRVTGSQTRVFECPRPERWPGTTSMRYGLMDQPVSAPHSHPTDASPLAPMALARIVGERLLTIDEDGRLTTLELGWLRVG